MKPEARGTTRPMPPASGLLPPSGPLELRAGNFRFSPSRVYLVGILNVTDDSFSGDGSLSADEVLSKARQLVEDGADILDVGGESARANRGAIPEAEEISRVVPILERLGSALPRTPLAINTWRPGVAEAGLSAGASILNDMGGLASDENARIAARHGAALVIMHLQGEPKQAHTSARYDDVLAELRQFFAEKIELALGAGLTRERILIDPGLDFAKQLEDNLRLVRELSAFRELGCPILLADSRKTFIGEVLGLEPADRDWGTLAVSLWASRRGARFLRVHNVAIHKDALKVLDACAKRSVDEVV